MTWGGNCIDAVTKSWRVVSAVMTSGGRLEVLAGPCDSDRRADAIRLLMVWLLVEGGRRLPVGDTSGRVRLLARASTGLMA